MATVGGKWDLHDSNSLIRVETEQLQRVAAILVVLTIVPVRAVVVL